MAQFCILSDSKKISNPPVFLADLSEMT